VLVLAPLAAVALVLLPGVLVVRAPWTAVPALSLAFWALSAWWPPFAGLSRGRCLLASLTAFGVLALLRLLPRHEVPPPPGWTPPPAAPSPPRPGLTPPRLASAPSLVVLGAAVALLAPLPLWHNPPGPALAFQTTTARLLVWRDGVPATAEPLLPLSPVGAHAPALATLAADASLLTGLDPARSVTVLLALAVGLLLVGLFALDATRAPPRPAALGAVVALAAAPWPDALAPWGTGEAVLALGLSLPAAALLLGHASRSSAVAAGMLVAAGLLAQPCIAAIVPVVCTIAAKMSPRERRSRFALCSCVALLMAAPGLVPLARALSPGEARSILFSIQSRDLLPFAFAVLLAALAPVLFAGLEGRPRAGRAVPGALAVVATALLAARVHGWIASGQVSEPVTTALARIAAETGPLQSVCAPEGAREWVPALAGRMAGEPGPWVPRIYADEWASRPRRPCLYRLESFLLEP
jgi:hypothetical protein